MNNNPIDELRNMEVPVSEQEWESIVHDKRYLKKFGKKQGLSPKGRAALIAGAAAALLTIPILVGVLSHKSADTVRDKQTVAQTETSQTETTNNASATVQPMSQSSDNTQGDQKQRALPSASSVTTGASTHEQSTLAAVTEARVSANSSPVLTNKPATTNATTTQPSKASVVTPEKTPASVVSDNKQAQTNHVENRPQKPNAIADDNQPTADKSQDETIADVEEFFIPSAFTPNGDGLNDLFFVKANFVPRTFEMSIFNRKGEMMFLSQDMDIGWDGQFHGQTLPSGVYICIIKYTDNQGVSHKTQGQVLLLP